MNCTSSLSKTRRHACINLGKTNPEIAIKNARFWSAKIRKEDWLSSSPCSYLFLPANKLGDMFSGRESSRLNFSQKWKQTPNIKLRQICWPQLPFTFSSKADAIYKFSSLPEMSRQFRNVFTMCTCLMFGQVIMRWVTPMQFSMLNFWREGKEEPEINPVPKHCPETPHGLETMCEVSANNF